MEREYINKSLMNYLEDNGINLIHSIPSNPQQKWSCRTAKLNS